MFKSEKWKYFVATVMVFYMITLYMVASLNLFKLADIRSKDYFDQQDHRTDKFFVELKITEVLESFRVKNDE